MIEIELPKSMELKLRRVFGGALDQIARDSLLMEAYRLGQVSIGQLAEWLGVSIDRAYGRLKEHGIPVNYSIEDFESDCQGLREMRTDGR